MLIPLNIINRSSHFIKVISKPSTIASIDLIIIFDYCIGCSKLRLQKMASVPQGLFAARKVRANMSSGWERSLLFESRQEQQGKQQNKQEQGSSWGGRQQSGSKDNWGGASPFPKLNQQTLFPVLDHPPARYNSKLMNSIWGLYNRYSVHNFKKIAGDVLVFGQQPHPAIPESCMTPGGSNPNVAATSSGALPARGAGPYMNPGGPGSSPAAAAPATSAPWENFLTAPEYRH